MKVPNVIKTMTNKMIKRRMFRRNTNINTEISNFHLSWVPELHWATLKLGGGGGVWEGWDREWGGMYYAVPVLSSGLGCTTTALPELDAETTLRDTKLSWVLVVCGRGGTVWKGWGGMYVAVPELCLSGPSCTTAALPELGADKIERHSHQAGFGWRCVGGGGRGVGGMWCMVQCPSCVCLDWAVPRQHCLSWGHLKYACKLFNSIVQLLKLQHSVKIESLNMCLRWVTTKKTKVMSFSWKSPEIFQEVHGFHPCKANGGLPCLVLRYLSTI